MLAYSLHACILIALASLHLHTYTCILLTLAYFALGCFRSSTYTGVRIAFMCVLQVWWKCQCVSVSVDVSVFKGFSGRTLRNAFGKKGNRKRTRKRKRKRTRKKEKKEEDEKEKEKKKRKSKRKRKVKNEQEKEKEEEKEKDKEEEKEGKKEKEKEHEKEKDIFWVKDSEETKFND